MKEQRQESEFIESCQSVLRLKCECTNDLCCHHIFFVVVVNVVTELARQGVLIELLYTDD